MSRLGCRRGLRPVIAIRVVRGRRDRGAPRLDREHGARGVHQMLASACPMGPAGRRADGRGGISRRPHERGAGGPCTSATPGTSPARPTRSTTSRSAARSAASASCSSAAEDGVVAALEDFCPHRGAPLSLGRVRDDGKLVCGYHGLVMGCDGKTRRDAGPARARLSDDHEPIPASSATASSGSGRATRRWPIRRSCIHLAWAESPEWAYGGGLYHVAVRLPADDRQPDGPDARDLRARDQHRPARDRRGGAGDARRGRRGDHQPLHDTTSWRRRSGAMALRGNRLRRRRAGRPLADLPLHAAQPRDDRGRRRARRPRRLRRAAGAQGRRASWSTSSPRRPTRRSGTSGAWRATSTSTTRR